MLVERTLAVLAALAVLAVPGRAAAYDCPVDNPFDMPRVLPAPATIAPRNTRIWLTTVSASDDGLREDGSLPESLCDKPQVFVDDERRLPTLSRTRRQETLETLTLAEILVLTFAEPLPAGASVVVRCEHYELTRFTTSDAEDHEAPPAPALGATTFERGRDAATCGCSEPPRGTVQVTDAEALSEPAFVWLGYPDRFDLEASQREVDGAGSTLEVGFAPDPVGAFEGSLHAVRLDLAGNQSASSDAVPYSYERAKGSCATSGGGAGLLATVGMHFVFVFARRLRRRRTCHA